MYKNAKSFNPREIRGSSTVLDAWVKSYIDNGISATLDYIDGAVENEKFFYYVFATDSIVKDFIGFKQVLILQTY